MPSDPLVLGFDTSGPWIGVALLRGTKVLAALHENMAKGQAETLFPMLDDVLKHGGVAWQDLTALGVGVGPGNFTGIRISVSAARGLSLSLDIPAVGVSILDALALDQTGPTLACLEAPRDQAYVQGFGTTSDIPLTFGPVDTVPTHWAEPGLKCIGTAGARIAAHLGAEHAPACYAPGSAIARLAAQRWKTCTTPPVPLYIKPADAAPPRDVPPVIVDDAA